MLLRSCNEGWFDCERWWILSLFQIFNQTSLTTFIVLIFQTKQVIEDKFLLWNNLGSCDTSKVRLDISPSGNSTQVNLCPDMSLMPISVNLISLIVLSPTFISQKEIEVLINVK